MRYAGIVLALISDPTGPAADVATVSAAGFPATPSLASVGAFVVAAAWFVGVRAVMGRERALDQAGRRSEPQ